MKQYFASGAYVNIAESGIEHFVNGAYLLTGVSGGITVTLSVSEAAETVSGVTAILVTANLT